MRVLARVLAFALLADALALFAGARSAAIFFAGFVASFLAGFLAATVFFVFSLSALLAFFDFFAMIVLPIVAADFRTHSGAIKHDLLRPYRYFRLFAPIVDRTGPSHAFQRFRHRSAGRPIDQRDRMNDRN